MRLKINRNAYKIVVFLIAVAIFLALFFAFLSKWETKYGSVDTDTTDEGQIYVNGTSYIPNKNLEVLLLIGVDKYESQLQDESYNNTEQADFLMLLVIDKSAETYTLLHLNRDTMTEIPILGVRGEQAGTLTGQLALAHTYGSGGADSCRNTVEAVSNMLYGIDIDHYLAFTMDAVVKINDLAGGVTLTVSDDLTSVSPKLSKGATVTLDGEMALAYVRTRYGLKDSSNLRRMERQRQYLTALQSALNTKMSTQEDFMLDVLEAISPYMTSDCTANQLSKLYDCIELYKNNGIQTIEGDAVKGEEYMEFYPDEDALKQQVIRLFYTPLEE